MWVLLYVLIAVAGVAVLAACGLRVLGEVRKLGREVELTARQVEPSLTALEEATDRGYQSHT